MKVAKKNNSLDDSPRRSLLKALAAGGSGLSAVIAMPERWTRPLVNSVILPAHAQTSVGALTSVVVPKSCEHGSKTIEDVGEIGLDDIFIVYDGATFCDIVTGDVAEGDSIPADCVIVIDADPNDNGEFLTWDPSGDGSNWNRTGKNFIDNGDSSNNPNGTYYVDVARASDPGMKFRVSFRVTITGTLGSISMTVDNIAITAI